MAGHQQKQITRQWWDSASDRFDLVASQLVLDEASGSSMGGLTQGGDMGLASTLLQLDAANRSQNLNIGSVAMEYRDESGEPLFVVATDQEKMSAFAAGEISKEELLLGTDIGLSNLLGGIGALSDAAGQ